MWTRQFAKSHQTKHPAFATTLIKSIDSHRIGASRGRVISSVRNAPALIKATARTVRWSCDIIYIEMDMQHPMQAVHINCKTPRTQQICRNNRYILLNMMFRAHRCGTNKKNRNVSFESTPGLKRIKPRIVSRIKNVNPTDDDKITLRGFR